MNASRKSPPNWGSCWRRSDTAGHLPIFPGIEHASGDIVDRLAMAAVECGATVSSASRAAGAPAGRPTTAGPRSGPYERVYAHLKNIADGGLS